MSHGNFLIIILNLIKFLKKKKKMGLVAAIPTLVKDYYSSSPTGKKDSVVLEIRFIVENVMMKTIILQNLSKLTIEFIEKEAMISELDNYTLMIQKEPLRNHYILTKFDVEELNAFRDFLLSNKDGVFRLNIFIIQLNPKQIDFIDRYSNIKLRENKDNENNVSDMKVSEGKFVKRDHDCDSNSNASAFTWFTWNKNKDKQE